MKVICTALIACLIIAGSCSKSKSPSKVSGDELSVSSTAKLGGASDNRGIQIPLNNCYDSVYVDSTGHDTVTVCFDSVLIDCRCPRKVECVWAGYAEVLLTITVNGTTESHALSTLSGGINSAVVNGYEITFVDLLPYPVYGVTPAPGSIRAVVSIRKI